MELLHALQVWPRAPWSQIAPVLGVNSVTLGRRWLNLTGRGLAWTTRQPGRALDNGAIVEVQCVAASINEVVSALAQDPACMSIDVVTGGRSLILTVVCSTAAELSRYLVSRLGEMSGVRTVCGPTRLSARSLVQLKGRSAPSRQSRSPRSNMLGGRPSPIQRHARRSRSVTSGPSSRPYAGTVALLAQWSVTRSKYLSDEPATICGPLSVPGV
jgi:DNA-binding Lrp family transcriptional regulator